jgi:hypothetical protein
MLITLVYHAPDVIYRLYCRHVPVLDEVCGADGGRPADPGKAVHQALDIRLVRSVDELAGEL